MPYETNLYKLKAIQNLTKKMEAVDTLSSLAERMAFKVDKKQAITLITLVFHYLWDEWQENGSEAVRQIIVTYPTRWDQPLRDLSQTMKGTMITDNEVKKNP